MTTLPDTDAVYHYLIDLQDRITTELGQRDGVANFREESWTREAGVAVAAVSSRTAICSRKAA